LGRESSPYLRQHAYNPVDWYPWGPEAFQRAARLDRPVFLSVGYAACHWCHVMEQESFEDEAIAKLLNEHFVAVKVDREERPDVDHLYMQAVQALTQRGGWPMSVFLTPSGAPFFAGTYFPPEDRHGMPSFARVLRGVLAAWEKQRSDVEKSAEQLVRALRELNAPLQSSDTAGSGAVLTPSIAVQGAKLLLEDEDPVHGGLGRAPKFFHAEAWRFLLAVARSGAFDEPLRDRAFAATRRTLDALARGGVRDQLRGGFHRYSVDDRWHVPHFEKMLYDNSLLPPWFLEGASAMPEHRARWVAVVRETLDWLLDEMSAPEGGFAATLDADSEGREGRYYLWTEAEIDAAVGDADAARAFKLAYGVRPEGNWEGTNVLFLARGLDEVAEATGTDADWVEAALALARRKLLAARAKRVRPERDDKVVLPWNAFAIETFALAARALGDDRYAAAAKDAYTFVGRKLRRDDATGVRLYHSYKDGAAKVPAFLDGYGALGRAALALFSLTGEPQYLHDAVAIADAIELRFFDASVEDFTFAAKDFEPLVTAVYDRHDGATPSALGLAVGCLVGTYFATGMDRYRSLAERTLRRHRLLLERAPQSVPSLLAAVDRLAGRTATWVLVEGDDPDAFAEARAALGRDVFPERMVLPFSRAAQQDRSVAAWPAFRDKTPVQGVLALYRCEGFVCDAPLVGLPAILAAQSDGGGAGP
jgi:uncharacterized protein YyaL (SSP411 family)